MEDRKTYDEVIEGVLSMNRARLDEARAKSSYIVGDELGMQFWAHSLESSKGQKA